MSVDHRHCRLYHFFAVKLVALQCCD